MLTSMRDKVAGSIRSLIGGGLVIITTGEMMQVDQAINYYNNYLVNNKKQTTVKGFRYTLTRFNRQFGDRALESITIDEVYDFLMTLAGHLKASTKCSRRTVLNAFYNFVIENRQLDIQNPCSSSIIKKVFRKQTPPPPVTYDKETVDKMIYRTEHEQTVLMLELMARACMRIGEVLNLFAADLDDRKLRIRAPKSGRVGEVVFISAPLERKLHDYIRDNRIQLHDQLFPFSYSTAYRRVRACGISVGIKIAPHDLRRHGATIASRAGVPLEIISKVFLRHADIATTQRYLGIVSDIEAIRWTDMLHA